MKPILTFALALTAALPALPVLAQTPAPSVTLFQNVRVFDGKSAALSEPTNVLVRGNKIERISAQPIPTDRRADTKIIEIDIECSGEQLASAIAQSANRRLVRAKLAARMRMEAETTALVVARPTPCAPPLELKPW